MRWGRWSIVGLIGAIMIAATSVGPVAAGITWDITRSPASTAPGAQATIAVTFWNLGGPQGDSDLGCVRILIPGAFAIVSAQVTDRPAGTTWKASVSGSTVTIKASNGGDRLGLGSGETVTADIVVNRLSGGTIGWVANAYEAQDCRKAFNEPIVLSILSTPVATPVPTPTRTTAPTPRPTPKPTAVPTPKPTSIASPGQTATAPSDTPTPLDTPAPTSQVTPSPSPTVSPTPLSTGQSTAGPRDTGGSGTSGTPTGGSTSGAGNGSASGSAAAAAPGIAISMPGVDGLDSTMAAIDLDGTLSLTLGEVEWMVPGLVMTVPGLLIVVVVGFQLAGGLAWLPVARRRLGRADVTRRRRRPSQGSGPL